LEEQIKESKVPQFFSDLGKISLMNLAKSLLCSNLNLIIYLIIATFVLGFAQGFVIPVDLYMCSEDHSHILNIFLFHFLLYFLALIMSLYPTYIFAILFEKTQGKYYNSKCCGLIYYGFPGNDDDISCEDIHKSKDKNEVNEACKNDEETSNDFEIDIKKLSYHDRQTFEEEQEYKNFESTEKLFRFSLQSMLFLL